MALFGLGLLRHPEVRHFFIDLFFLHDGLNGDDIFGFIFFIAVLGFIVGKIQLASLFLH